MSAEARRENMIVPLSRRRVWLRARMAWAWRFLTARFSSSLTRRIVVLNIGGLLVLVIGFLLLNQFRADSRVKDGPPRPLAGEPCHKKTERA